MRNLFIYFLIFLLSCSSKKIKWEDLEIVVTRGDSYRYDLAKETYTVFFMERPAPLEIHFTLSAEEKEQILEKYIALRLDKDSTDIKIEDGCMQSPKIYSKLKTIARGKTQEILIDMGCDIFKGIYAKKGFQVKEFIQFISRIIKAKPEVENAPDTDIIYY